MDTMKNDFNWISFMNGYRDPKTNAQAREARRREIEQYEEDYSSPGFSEGADSERECGFRKEGGTYATVPTSPNGKPVDDFLSCPPIPIDAEEYGLGNVGVRLIDFPLPCSICQGKKLKGKKFACPGCFDTGEEVITHIFDIVGQNNYPNVADFIEEARRLGISRRLELQTSEEYGRLTSRSRLFLLHKQAVILNPGDVIKSMYAIERERFIRASCPKKLLAHTYENEDFDNLLIDFEAINKSAPGCAALHWNLIEGGDYIPEIFGTKKIKCGKCAESGKIFGIVCPDCNGLGYIRPPGDQGKFVERVLVSGSYRGYQLPEEVKPKFALGVFGVFPLGALEVVDPSGEYEDKLDKASSAKLDVRRVEC